MAGRGAGLASSTILTVIISPRLDALEVLEPWVRQALPTETLASAQDAGEALHHCKQARYLGRTTAVFLLDFRGTSIDHLTNCVTELRQALRNSELIILFDATDSPALAACLKVAGSTERMTFLTAPLDGTLMVRTLKAAA